MIKSIIKETIILILLCVAIILTLGIVFYNYIPTSKVVPKPISYITPDNIKQELDQSISEKSDKEIIKTYQINKSDLNSYQSTGTYNEGKVNPFAEYVNSSTITNTTTENTTTQQPAKNANTISNKTDTNTVGHFFDTGNK